MESRLTQIVFGLVFIMVAGCTKDDGAEPQNTLDADAGSDQTVFNGTEVLLDGSESFDESGNAFSILWQFTSRPDGSNASLSNENTLDPTFTTDVEGEYVVRLTISNDLHSDTDEVVITSEANSPETILGGSIDTDITLEDINTDPNQADYCVNESIELNAQMIIKPGVTIAFEENTHFSVKSNGILVAIGEEEKKISLIAKDTEKPWKGLAFILSDNVKNELDHVNISHAGSDLISIASDKAALTVASFSEVKISNVNIEFSKALGMMIDESSEVEVFANNRVANGEGRPIKIAANHVAILDAATSFGNNNAEDIIEVYDGNLNEEEAQVWSSFDDETPYLFTDHLEIDSELRLSPGITMYFESDIEVEVGNYGILVASGTAEKKITFTAYNQELPWRGIGFVLSSSVRNTLEHVEISYAGLDIISILDKKAALGVGSFSRVSLNNCNVTHSVSNGIFVDDSSILTSFEGNIITNNDVTPLIISLKELHQIDAETEIGDTNGNDYIQILGGTLDRDEEVTWPVLSDETPYYVAGNIEINSGLTISPGSKFMFDSDIEFRVGTGFLQAQGTSENRIILTAFNTALPWRGIGFFSDNARNTLSYADINYGGSDYNFVADKLANVAVGAFDRLSMDNCNLSNGQGYGFYYSHNSTIVDTNNVYTGNNLGDVFVEN